MYFFPILSIYVGGARCVTKCLLVWKNLLVDTWFKILGGIGDNAVWRRLCILDVYEISALPPGPPPFWVWEDGTWLGLMAKENTKEFEKLL